MFQDGSVPPQGQFGAGSSGIICPLGVTADELRTALNYVAQYDALARQSVFPDYGTALHSLFLESYAGTIDYEKYFKACGVDACNYIASIDPTYLEVRILV